MVCSFCAGAALDTAVCRRGGSRQHPERLRPLQHDASPAGEAPASLVELGKTTLRYQVVESAASAGRAGRNATTLVMSPDPPNTLEHHSHCNSELSSRGLRVLLFEAPGFGFSTPAPDFRFTVPEYSDVMEQLLERDGRAPYVLALSCVAGLAARNLAHRRPDLVSGLVSVQTPSWAQQLDWARRQDSMGILRIPIVGQTAMLASHKMVINSWYPLALGRRSQGSLEPFKAAADAARLAGAHNSLASAFQMLAHPPHGEAPSGGGGGGGGSSGGDQGAEQLRVPCLAIWGADDKSHRMTDRRSTLRVLPQGTQMVEWEGVGHFPELEAPERFAELVAGFVATTASSAAQSVSSAAAQAERALGRLGGTVTREAEAAGGASGGAAGGKWGGGAASAEEASPTMTPPPPPKPRL